MKRDDSTMNISTFVNITGFIVIVVFLCNILLNIIDEINYTCSKPQPIVALDKLYFLRYCDKDVSNDKTKCLHNGSEFECYTSPDSTVQYR